ncbi:glycosyl hydrolase family 18 protein [Paucisalibacillus globulus]|uniref:glycosyl hydrolase family 18 protein n=1 Tax=Paucisalibacillus globulus TaxID=351095 RepID=UPI000400A8F5|nr:glycosyl hydrolase family 18 protein [Paucisalibacillus globulus]
MKRLKILLVICATLILSLLQQITTTHSQSGFFNMSYIFFGSPSSYINQVNQTKGSLDVVSPNYFDVTEDGDLTVTWKLQTSFIEEMHRRGVKVVPFLANHWNVTAGKKALDNRDALARKVADAVKKYNLDGVNVDIEGIGNSYRDAHTDFIRLLREYLPADKEVSVATAANPNGWTTGWHGFYDYKALSKYVDYLMIMAYDESWESPDSPIGPVSSIQFFERSIQYAINQGVPEDRIVVGLPFYGRMWKLDGNSETAIGKKITGLGLSSNRVKPLIEKFSGTISFDKNTQSNFAEFTIPSGQSAFVGSTELTAGNYVIWYDDQQAIKAKLALPNEYGIKGTGSWALYHEVPEMWDYYTLWLNRLYFKDVAENYWASGSINRVAELGWMAGTTNITFSPKKTLTRAEGAVILVRALGENGLTPNEFQFKDTTGHWAQREIEIARELGLVGGITTTSFAPNAPLTREQLATIFQNIFKYPINYPINNGFPDVNTKKWSYHSIVALTQQGILGGYPDGSFKPTSSSTRADMAALMERMQSDFNRIRND